MAIVNADAPVTTSSRVVGEYTDWDLVMRVRAGDDTAFEVLFARYHDAVARYIRRMVNDAGRAEDITQEVFVSAMRRLRRTETDIVFKPWVYEIAKNACIDQFRRAKRVREVSIDADTGLAPADRGRLESHDAAPDRIIDGKASLTHLRGALDGISDAHQEILVLRELEGRSYQEIGERLNLSRPSVESTLFRARRSLSREFSELESGERCRHVRCVIAEGGRIGVRDRRRLSSHFAHCAPCRRIAVDAGVDPELLHRPLRDRIAALLPVPFFLRRRLEAGDGAPSSHVAAAHLGPALSDPSTAGWGRAAAAAAALVAAGLGAGTATHVIGGHDSRHQPTPAARSANGAGVLRTADRVGAGAARTPATGSASHRSGAHTQQSSAPRLREQVEGDHTAAVVTGVRSEPRRAATAPVTTEAPRASRSQGLGSAPKSTTGPLGTTPARPPETSSSPNAVSQTATKVKAAVSSALAPPQPSGEPSSSRSTGLVGRMVGALKPGH